MKEDRVAKDNDEERWITCPTCGGNRTVKVPRTDKDGNTIMNDEPCPQCGMDGRVRA